MKRKKGFTLVELLAVIAILAILVIIALPNVLRMFRNAKENTFVTEVQEILKTAEQKYISTTFTNNECTCFSSKSTDKKHNLDMSGRNNIEYYVEFNDKGEVINLIVKDDSYQFVSEGEVIKVADIGNSTSGKKKTSTPVQETIEVPSCDGSSGSTTGSNKFDIKYSSMLKGLSFNFDYTSDPSDLSENQIQEWENYNMYFLGLEKFPRDSIESIKIVNTIPEEVKNKYQQNELTATSNEILGVADVTNDSTGNILMWWTDEDSNGKYEVTIGGEGGVRANTDSSYLFAALMNLTSIDLTYLDTSNVTSMLGMFMSCSNLKTLDLSHFDTSQVINMFGMFMSCSNLKTLDLSKFDTSKVETMNRMFFACNNLTTLDTSNLIIKENADIECMLGNSSKFDIYTNENTKQFINKYSDRLYCYASG